MVITLVYFFSISPVDLVEPDGEVILDFWLKCLLIVSLINAIALPCTKETT